MIDLDENLLQVMTFATRVSKLVTKLPCKIKLIFYTDTMWLFRIAIVHPKITFSQNKVNLSRLRDLAFFWYVGLIQ